ncbi:allophanate hydrolase [Coccomyxa subellipsoidea C-169]|uniref:Allophanate hydrolase n=1 Tax=Coccomyxa subellipsoidea (strain C-169) TaxID=574566 RepID=I0YQ77_COCSC|nr:allophanate hydrolase [Coccomyxa subellipsoidea C-169]EIE20546.1 allophanate hydrolase [Coccomyxa subellipsoidea C-169]|eukprot:XP_005645090.1 allophanate hydrolase [Coccomyxa subellipsoidea C-169]
MGDALGLQALQGAYRDASTSPTDVIRRLYPLLAQEEGMFITLASLESLLERCRILEVLPPAARGPLYGVPFAVKDNIDVAGFPTTAACEAYRYTPSQSAPGVEALLEAGGVMVGKTNLDQFAAGLVGTRTPYGTARNPFDDRFLPGGSSSGSGAAVGCGLLTFALGTDTAGSGRVPAHFCGCVGIKPTVGRVSSTGVVRACRALDCISVFARSVPDAAEATPPSTPGQSAPGSPGGLPNGHAAPPNGHAAKPSFRFGLPDRKYLSFAGPGGDAFALVAAAGYERLYGEAVQMLQQLGGVTVPIDFEPFAATANLLYTSAFLAERYSGVRTFLEAGQVCCKGTPTEASVAGDARMERVTGAIMAGSLRYCAVDVFDALTTLNELKGRARVELAKVDFLLVPSAAHHYTVAEIEAEEKQAEAVSWPKNANLGRFTNFVNLMDMAAIAVPSGVLHCEEPSAASDPTGEVARRAALLRETGNSRPVLPFGVTLIGAAWSDESLWAVAERFHAATGLGCGPDGFGVKPYRTPRAA